MSAKSRQASQKSKNTEAVPGPYSDPALEVFEKGLKLLHKQKWNEAGEQFARVAEESDLSDLASRARLFRSLCEERADDSPDIIDDPYDEAVLAKNRGDLDSALEICSRGGRRSKDEKFAYLAAAATALKGDVEQAVELLGVAIELNPVNRVHAFHDSDFQAARDSADFRALFQGS